MALLKKVRSATLIEALLATILIVVVFVIASLVLNNLVFNAFSNNTHSIDNRIYELQYNVKDKILRTPYSEEFNNWDIKIEEQQAGDKTWYTCTAVNKTTNKEITKSILYAN